MRTAILLAILMVCCLGAQGVASGVPAQGPVQEPQAAPKAPVSESVPPAQVGVDPAVNTGDPSKLATPAGPKASGAAPVNQKTYLIGAEDVVKVIVWANAGLSGDFMVRPDGAISLPLVGDVQVAGSTPQEVQATITQLLKDQKLMLDPHVSVGLSAVHSKKYYLQGEVNRPGSYDLVVPLTVMEALVNAGGFRDFANTKKIRIQRGPKEFKFNYNWVSHGKHLEQNIYLEPRDIIIVP